MKYKKTLLTSIIVIIILLCSVVQFSSNASSKKTQENMDSEAGKSALLSILITDIRKEPNHNSRKKSPYEDIKFVDKEAFTIIEKAYNEVNFCGEFKQGNLEEYNFYKEQYHKLLKCEATFFNEQNQKETYIDEFIEADAFDIYNYLYSFFDIDDDGAPELCVTTSVSYVYIFKYYPDSDKFMLWYEIHTSWAGLLGSRKLWYYLDGAPFEYKYYKLDENGNEEYVVQFCFSGYYNSEKQEEDVLHMLTMTRFVDETKNAEFPKNIKKQAFVDYQRIHYFRVTEEQWVRLTKSFFEAIETAKKNIKKVTFTYDELFGAFQN